jgi:hypothetical protein
MNGNFQKKNGKAIKRVESGLFSKLGPAHFPPVSPKDQQLRVRL